jgi:predicted nucleic acid-binding protein
MIVALDTNILAYAEGVNGVAMKALALELLQKLPQGATVLPVQSLGELFNVLVRKAKRTPANARAAILSWRDAFPLVETSPAVMLAAADLATDHQFGIWDAVILCAAVAADCRLLLSEDLQDGFTWSGVTIVNPFAPTKHVLLDALLEDAGRP